jgi:ABC-2 type transport system permease protein
MSATPNTPARRLRLASNPVMVKELRGRMRGSRAFVLLTVYLVLMSGFTMLMYMLAFSARNAYGFTSGGQIGRVLFIGIVGMALFLISFIAPAFTAGALSGERERQTYDLLRTTMLSARALVFGKMLSALAFIGLLLVATVPLQSIAFLFGGVTETEILVATIILLTTAISFSALGIYFSARARKSATANALAYGFTMAFLVGLPIAGVLLSALLNRQINPSTSPGMYTGFTYIMLLLLSLSPIGAGALSQQFILQYGFVPVFDFSIGSGLKIGLLMPWIPFVVFHLFATFILLNHAVRRVNRIDIE